MEPFSSRELVRDCQERMREDPRVFARLVSQYKQLVYTTAYRIMGNHEDAEDQAQEAFLKIYRRIHELEDPATLTAWIYRITVNTCLDTLKKQKRRPRAYVPLDQENDECDCMPDTGQPTPEEAVLRREVQRCLEETLSQLDGPGRAVILLCDIEERPYQEIAQILGLGLSAVKMRIHRTRLAFQQLLNRICPDVWKSGARGRAESRVNARVL